MNEHRQKTALILGIELPTDDKGRVDLSAVNRYSGSGKKSPAEWARTGRYKQLHKLLTEQYGMADGDIWEVEGERKGARTWVEPMVARAYIEDLEVGKCACSEIVSKIERLESRINELENVLFGGEG